MTTLKDYDRFEDIYKGEVAVSGSTSYLRISAPAIRGSAYAYLTQAMALRIRDAINVFLRETDYQGSEEDENSPFVTQREEDYYRDLKERNDCRLALAQFMAGYGNCDIPGALLTLAHKPPTEVGGVKLTERDACEYALFKAWMRGRKALGLTIEPQSKEEK